MYSLAVTMPTNTNNSHNPNYSINYTHSLNEYDSGTCDSSCTDQHSHEENTLLHSHGHNISLQVNGNDVESLYNFFTHEASSYHPDDINFNLQHTPFETLDTNIKSDSLLQQPSISQQNSDSFFTDLSNNVDVNSYNSSNINLSEFGNLLQRHQSVPNFVSTSSLSPEYQNQSKRSKLYETQSRAYSLSPHTVGSSTIPSNDSNFTDFGAPNKNVDTRSISSTMLTSSLIAEPSLHTHNYHPPSFDLEREVKSIVRLAHRNKDINIADIKDPQKSASLKAKILKKIKSESTNLSNSLQANKRVRKIKPKQLPDVQTSVRHFKAIGRPLTSTTKVRLTLVPSLPTLYSMLATEPIESLSKPPTAYKDLRGRFHILKKGKLFDFQIDDELKYDSTVDWRFKTVSANDVSSQVSTPNSTVSNLSFSDTTSTGAGSGGVFPGKYQTVVFVDSDDHLPKQPAPPQFPSAIGIDDEGFPMYKDINLAIQELFGVPEYTLLRVTRAAAFEKTGAIVLKMETIKPGDPWIDDDEFDLRLMYKLFSTDDVPGSTIESSPTSSETDQITTTFLKKKIARPRYKSYMRIYLLPRDTNVVMYTRESMLRRDIVNGTLKLHDNTDPRLILTSFDYTNVLRELNIIQ